MPASEETYYSQPNMHRIFAITSIAMTLSVVWMIMADHLRPWKRVQREFHRVEAAKLLAAEQAKAEEQNARSRTQLEAIENQIKEAEATADQNAGRIRAVDREIKALGGDFDRLDIETKFQKAELDSQRSFYDGMIDRGDVEQARLYLRSTIDASEKKLLLLTEQKEAAERKLRAAETRREALRGNVAELEKERKRLTREVDNAKRAREQKEAQYGEGPWYSRLLASFRDLPLIDMAAPATKIQQISLPELTINYNFKDVPRYDRCTTCHAGIDKLGYDVGPDGKPMPTVFAAHPHLTDGATSVDFRGNEVHAGLYLDANGPHPVNSFGCTICHGGQGSGTDFTYASHEPDDLEQKEHWEEAYNWHEMHMWDEPMLPARFLQASCLKCHHQVTDVPQAEKLQAGYRRIVKYGCTGCHTIGGEGSFGPDLTDERQVGPNLGHIASKVTRDWTLKWIKNPHAFRPDTRMPRFYGLTNNEAPGDWPKNHAEIHAITHYLFATSTPPAEFVKPPAKGDPAHGKDLFLQKGCMACHEHKEYDPAGFPEAVRDYARADFGPNLSNIAAKFQSSEQGYTWLANWIQAPERYHPRSLMPNLQLSAQDAADIAAWIVSIKGEWPEPVDVPPVDSPEVQAGLDELVKLYVAKAGGMKLKGKQVAVSLSEVDEFVARKLSRDDKLMYLGERTISRLGCFGCHTIPGFEGAKPIGTPLNGWGFKSPTKLDYAHIAEYLQDQPVGDGGARDGTDLYFQEKLADHTRSGFLYQKIHRPRSYDYRKTNADLKAWDERLRMPQFSWANDPKAIEEVMTFVLGLTGEKIAAKYLPKSHYRPAQVAAAEGAKLLNRYNCKGCHVVEMPRYTIAAGAKLEEALTAFATNVRVAYGARANDYLAEFYPGLSHDPKKQPELKPHDGKAVTIEGMPIATFENELTVQVWRPVTIRGFTFNVGDNLTLDRTKVQKGAADGGNFAWLFATHEAERTGTDFATLWNRLPPPLLREGRKVQTPWLTAFLQDPYPIRPAVNLRMPHFHFGRPGGETAGLADYFAAVDRAEFPYQTIPERERSYLSSLEAQHPNYLDAGWQIMTKGACVQCHAIGQFQPTGGSEVVNGPDLRQVAARFRPGYLGEWLANPRRLIPYTAMPQNVPPPGPPPPFVPKTFENKPLAMVKAMRDTLLNYLDAVELQLAGLKPAGAKPAGDSKGAAAPAPSPGAGSGGGN